MLPLTSINSLKSAVMLISIGKMTKTVKVATTVAPTEYELLAFGRDTLMSG